MTYSEPLETPAWAQALVPEGMVVQIEAMEEDVEIRGNVLASGDDETDKAEEDAVIRRLGSGDLSAWFCAKVTVVHDATNISATAYLGGCSYACFEDFTSKEDSYLADIIEEAAGDCENECVRVRDLLRDFCSTAERSANIRKHYVSLQFSAWTSRRNGNVAHAITYELKAEAFAKEHAKEIPEHVIADCNNLAANPGTTAKDWREYSNYAATVGGDTE